MANPLTLPRTRLALQKLFQRRPRLLVPLWWGAAFVAVAVYAQLRGKMDDVGLPVHGSELETGLFGSLPTLWLQRHLFSLWPDGIEWGTVVVHASWFFVPMLASVFVTWRRPERIGSFFRWWITLQVLALVLFALFPLEPPWMASPEVTRVIALRFGGEIEDPNQLAAMPSLHVTFPLMISLWFFRERWKAPALVMRAYASLTAFEVVFSGEHYIVDVMGAAVVAGAIYVAAQMDYRPIMRALSPARFLKALGAPRRVVQPALQAVTEVAQRERGRPLKVRDLIKRRPRLRASLWWCTGLLSLLIYALLRTYMDDIGFPVHGAEIETTLFGSLPTAWLQRHIYAQSPAALEWVSVVIHGSWFFVPMLAAIVVTVRRIERIGSFFRWWMILQVLVLPAFALLPLQPPWMASQDVVRIIAIPYGGEIDDGNPLAAMPSLHVALPLVISLWFFRERWKAPALVMLAYASLTAFEVVFSGEHYIVDVMGAAIVAGAIYVAAQMDYRAIMRALSPARLLAPIGARRRALAPALRAVRQALQRERAQALIELAFILPLILVFMLVLVDFGLALDRRLVLQHAVSEGVREAAVNDNTTQIKDITVDQSQGILDPADVTVCYVDMDGNTVLGDIGDRVQVDAAYTYQFTAGGGEMLQAFGVTPPEITMNPSYSTALQIPVAGGAACP